MLWLAPEHVCTVLCSCHPEQLLSTRANTQHRNHWQNPLSESLIDKPFNRWTAPNICWPCVPLMGWIYWASGSVAGTLWTEAGYFYTSVPCFGSGTWIFMFHHQQHLRIGHLSRAQDWGVSNMRMQSLNFPKVNSRGKTLLYTDFCKNGNKVSGTAHK